MGNLLPSLGRRKLPMLELPKVGGSSALQLKGTVRLTAASTDVVAPPGTTEFTAFVRAGGGGGLSASPYTGGGGGAEECCRGPIAGGQVITGLVGAGGVVNGSGSPSSISVNGVTLCRADPGRSGVAGGLGGVASANGISGVTATSSYGGDSGAFSRPAGPGGAGAGGVEGKPGAWGGGGGGASGSYVGAGGGQGVITILFWGP